MCGYRSTSGPARGCATSHWCSARLLFAAPVALSLGRAPKRAIRRTARAWARGMLHPLRWCVGLTYVEEDRGGVGRGHGVQNRCGLAERTNGGVPDFGRLATQQPRTHVVLGGRGSLASAEA